MRADTEVMNRVFQGKKESTDALTQGSQTVFQENTKSCGM